MKKGYLFISNSREMTKDQLDSVEPYKTGSFEAPSLYAANKMKWILYQGINRSQPERIKSLDYEITFYNQNIFRNIFDLKANLKAYNNLCEFLKKHRDIDIIHCNTPIGGVIGRICGHKFNKKVIYTAHGFHFYNGAPLLNKIVFRWVEKFLARFTDLLITINNEDFEASKNFKLKRGGRYAYVPGVGINLELYKKNDTEKRNKKRNELGLKSDDVLLISMGDLVRNKNHSHSLKVIAAANNPRLKYIICGEGPEKNKLRKLAKTLNITNQVHLLGYRNDIKDLLYASDIFIFTTLREGLPRSAMESMAAGLPCLMSSVRGNVDLIENETGGFLCDLNNITEWVCKLNQLANDSELRKKMGEFNSQRIKNFDIKIIQDNILELFKSL